MIEMYFWPNSVVGRISMLMFSGMFLADAGTSATLMTACLPSLLISRTCADQGAVAAYVAELGQLQAGVLGLDRDHRRVA